MSQTVRQLLDQIIADAVTRVSDRQDALSQEAARLSVVVGHLATAHRLAELAKEFFDFAEHGIPGSEDTQ